MSPRLRVSLFIAAALFLFFFLLDRIPLWSSDEGRYGEIAREMFESGNFIIAYFNEVPYLDKPILAPLFTAGTYALLGVGDFTTRLIPVTSALLGILVLYLFAKRLFRKRAADFSALLLLTTVGYVLVGRFAVIDMLMTFWISLSLCGMFRAFVEKQPRFYLLAYVFMGLGTLTKGLIGFVIPGFVFLIFLAWTRNLGELKRMKIPAGILIIAALFLPWLLAAMKKFPGFFDSFIVEQHFERFATGSFGRRRPFWFFLPIFFALGAPWTLFFPAAAFHGLKQPAPERLKIQFLISWIAGLLIFFSIPKSKLPYYILPATVPLALLVGNFFAGLLENPERIPRRFLAWTWRVLAGVAVVAALGFNVYLFFTKVPDVMLLKNLARAGSVLLAMGILTAFLIQRKNPVRAVLCLAATIYGGLLLTFYAMKMLIPSQSTAQEARFLKSLLRDGDRVAVYASPDRFSDLSFHLRKRLILVGPDWGTLKDQLDRIPRDERQAFYPGREEFIAFFNSDTVRIFCLMAPDWFQEIKGMGLRDFQVLREGHDKILIVNF